LGFNGVEEGKKMKRRRRKESGIMEEIKRRRLAAKNLKNTCWWCVCDNPDHTMNGGMNIIRWLGIYDDVDALHVKIDNINDMLVRFCFIRSIDYFLGDFIVHRTSQTRCSIFEDPTVEVNRVRTRPIVIPTAIYYSTFFLV
jgi:hypothetical protein